MGNLGISPNASDKEKIKAEYADYLHGLNSCGEIPYEVYSEAFDIGMDLMEECYEQGKKDAVVHGYWIHDINNLYGCSECLERETMSHRKKKSYCPNCGAKMDAQNVTDTNAGNIAMDAQEGAEKDDR